jgi:hypothetical protein
VKEHKPWIAPPACIENSAPSATVRKTGRPQPGPCPSAEISSERKPQSLNENKPQDNHYNSGHQKAATHVQRAQATCFAIAPIGPKDSDIRKRSDKVLKHIFRKALAEKYDVIRGDEIDEPGNDHLASTARCARVTALVADLTGHNPNVLHELAVRHAIEKPIIHAIEPKPSNIAFDISGFRLGRVRE